MSPALSPSEKPLMDCLSKDPNIPRVVTIRECGEHAGHYERTVTFPDGSAQTEFFFRERYGYLASQDLVGQFLAEWCDLGTPRCVEAAADLYGAWCVFAKFVGESPGTQRRFAARLERHGLIRERVNHARLYRGIRLMRRGERDGEVHEVRQAAR